MKKYLLTAICICLTLFFLQQLLMPKYMEGATEGAFVAEYYEVLDTWPESLQKAAARDGEAIHDVLFFGDCELYNNVSTAALWRDFGINSYIRGTPQQTVWQSYYLMRETLLYEKPRVIVFSVFAMQYDTPQSEIYNRMTLDGMRWSRFKAGAVRASMTPDEHMIEYVFPLLRFHDRWKMLEAQDIRHIGRRNAVTYHGYDLRTGCVPAGTLPTPLPLESATFGANATSWLEKIVQLCKENGIPLVLVKAPSLWPYWYEEWEEEIRAFAAANDLPYLNLSLEETGLDFRTDTYDGGLHLNVQGAEKVASYLGEYLQNRYDLPDRRGDAVFSAHWEPLLDAYDRAKQP